jgi:two-component system, sensor histidine kinase
MQDHAKWMDVPFINGHEAQQPPPNDFFGTAFHDLVAGIKRRGSPRRRSRLRMADLVSANRRKDEFLAMVSHELRSPLASIHNAVHFLSSQVDETPARRQMHALLERQVQRMTQLVDDLLDVSRILNGRLQLRLERIDLRTVVNHAIETAAPDINARSHRLITASPDAPVWLQADSYRLEQVFVNLLANAAKYTDNGGKVTVRVYVRDSQAVIRICDSGMGIAADALPQVFGLFKQANEADPRSRSGLGVGLAVVRMLVELHGGSVGATSGGPGQGSEFTVRLPLDGL